MEIIFFEVVWQPVAWETHTVLVHLRKLEYREKVKIFCNLIQKQLLYREWN